MGLTYIKIDEIKQSNPSILVFFSLDTMQMPEKKFAYSTHTYRPRNGYETVGNIKRKFIDSFKQLELATKVDCVTGA